MSDGYVDGLWPHFAPLWVDLRAVTPNVLLAGGYALFLKQRWLVSQISPLASELGQAITTEKAEEIIAQEVRTLVEMSRWVDGTPRVTKDFDLLVSLDLIASADDQAEIDRALKKHEFASVPGNARWQFQKKITKDQDVTLDFHALAPAEKRTDLRIEQRRIKPRTSLGQGIHGRQNSEAVGANLRPFAFTLESVSVQIPNPVTLAMMKMVAVRDRQLKGRDADASPEKRAAENRQAVKHANDLFKVIAMVTQEENEHISDVLVAVRGAECFDAAAQAYAEHFQADDGWGAQVVRDSWRPEDFAVIRSTLSEWFTPR